VLAALQEPKSQFALGEDRKPPQVAHTPQALWQCHVSAQLAQKLLYDSPSACVYILCKLCDSWDARRDNGDLVHKCNEIQSLMIVVGADASVYELGCFKEIQKGCVLREQQAILSMPFLHADHLCSIAATFQVTSTISHALRAAFETALCRLHVFGRGRMCQSDLVFLRNGRELSSLRLQALKRFSQAFELLLHSLNLPTDLVEARCCLNETLEVFCCCVLKFLMQSILLRLQGARLPTQSI
jgi:hypothetical protein